MDIDNELCRCHEQIRRLTAENQELRRASTFFADLAERLNRELCAERRLKADERRHIPRHTADALGSAAAKPA